MRALALITFVISLLVHPQQNIAMAPNSSGMADLPRGINTKTGDQLLFEKQIRDNPQLPPVEFWLAVARCETAHGLNGRSQWKRGYHWKTTTVTGAMGIATSAWLAYGGDQFATRAARASKWEQLIVANRIGFLGWQTKEFRTWEDRVNNLPLFRYPAGFDQGWGGKCREAWVRKNGLP